LLIKEQTYNTQRRKTMKILKGGVAEREMEGVGGGGKWSHAVVTGEKSRLFTII
jgi:hypothetical protein